MRRPLAILLALAGVTLAVRVGQAAEPASAVPLRLGTEQFLVSAWQPGMMMSPLALEGATLGGFEDQKDKDKKQKKEKKPHEEGMGLGPERARILLQSLTVPGWGQATLGHGTSAQFFAFTDLAIWVGFASFRTQEQMRRESFRKTALLGAGIDLRGRDEEYRRIVGAFISSDEYNLLVVSRDAANLYLRDLSNPDMAGYRAYIEKYSLKGSDAWNWTSQADFERYSAQRKDAQRASIRANNMLALAVANRIVSALHAARLAGRTKPKSEHAWRFEFAPAPGDDATAFQAALRTSF